MVDRDVNFDNHVKDERRREAGIGSTREPNRNENTVACQIRHLARPLLETLAKGDDQ
jgi:hypothetical protein